MSLKKVTSREKRPTS